MILWITRLAVLAANRRGAIISSEHDTTTQFSHVRFCRQRPDVVCPPLNHRCADLPFSDASRFFGDQTQFWS
jgi:hypothetical protein